MECHEKQTSTHFDKVLVRTGEWNRYQVLTFLLIGVTVIPFGGVSLANIFIAALPDHWCLVRELASNVSVEEMRQLSAPALSESSEEIVYSKCEIYNVRYEDMNVAEALQNVSAWRKIAKESGTIGCTDWQYGEKGLTITSRWNLVCGEKWKRALATSIYMTGFLLGCAIFGYLSDKIGRKPSFLIAYTMLVVCGFVSTFLPEYWSHVFLRLLSSIGGSGSYCVGFVAVMEAIGPTRRMMPGLLFQLYYTIGYMLLAVLAYVIHDYRILLTMGAAASLCVLPFCYWFMMESPRWLLMKGRHKEACRVTKKIADINKTDYPEDLMQELICKTNEDRKATKKNYTLVDLLRTPKLRVRSLIIFFVWFVNSLVYYGLSLGVSDLAGSPSVNLFISGAMEFPGILLAVFTLDRVGRRWPLTGLMVGGGVACILVPAIPQSLSAVRNVLAMIGKFGISGSFAVIYVFTTELFPTVIRTIGLGSGSMSARVGGLLAPFVAELGHLTGWMWLPMVVCGASSIMAGLLSLLLPETLGQSLPENLQDGENFGCNGIKKEEDRKIADDVIAIHSETCDNDKK